MMVSVDEVEQDAAERETDGSDDQVKRGLGGS